MVVFPRRAAALVMALPLCSLALVTPVPLCNSRRGRLTTTRRLASSEDMLAEAAKLRAEIAEAEEASPPPMASPTGAEEAKAKISAALKKATQLRDKEQLRIALSAAEESGIFSGDDEVVRKAVVAFNQLSELSDTMRQRLVSEARSQGGDPSVDWNPSTAYIAIFGVITLLVIFGGKGIFY